MNQETGEDVGVEANSNCFSSVVEWG